jgi:hypothetical protein
MKFLGLVVLFAYGAAHADGARIGIEYESEKDHKTGMMNDAVTAEPGWEFSKDSLINLVELLIERNQDANADSNGLRARETNLFVRLRHYRKYNESLGYYIRGGVGRSINNQQNFNYAYIEPGLKYGFSEKWEWTLAFREINSIDGTAGQHVRKYIAGPSFSFDKSNELEFRYFKGYGDKDLTSWQVGYTRKF